MCHPERNKKHAHNAPKITHRQSMNNKTFVYTLGTQYYYGSTSLFKGKKRVFKWSLKHSLILFRGKIFEWGLGRPKTYKMNRSPSDCKIKWTWSSKGSSRCRLSDAETWTRNYRRRYGGYRLFTNNCHYFVNRFMSYLRSNCGR